MISNWKRSWARAETPWAPVVVAGLQQCAYNNLRTFPILYFLLLLLPPQGSAKRERFMSFEEWNEMEVVELSSLILLWEESVLGLRTNKEEEANKESDGTRTRGCC